MGGGGGVYGVFVYQMHLNPMGVITESVASTERPSANISIAEYK